MPTLPAYPLTRHHADLSASVFEEMLNLGTVTPRFWFLASQGAAADFKMYHPLYGEFSSSLLDDEVAAAFSVVGEVYEYLEDLSAEGMAKHAEYEAALAKWDRRSILAWLRKRTIPEPDRSEIREIAERAMRVNQALKHLANLFILLHEDIIAPEVFDSAVQALDLENLIASPIEPIVIIDEPADEVPAETDVAAQPEAEPAPV